MSKICLESASPLREAAEARLVTTPGTEHPDLSGEKLLHEFRVHQVELEIQNEELCRAQLTLAESRDKYLDLYDHAPVGYLTVADTGLVVAANLTIAALLGLERDRMLGRRFDFAIAPEHRDRWHREFISLLRHEKEREFDLPLQHASGQVFHVHVNSTHILQEGQCPAVHLALTDVTERVRAEETLREAHERLHELLTHQERIKENERIHIARELHDELGGLLMGIRANVSFAMDRDRRAGGIANPHLLDACEQLDLAQDALRKVTTDLRPSVLDHLGIWTALEWYAGQTAARTGLACHVTMDASAAEVVIDSERSTALFRILQETLTNVVRHAGATQVEIRISHADGLIRMEVEDNGRGIDAGRATSRQSWGIAGMNERAHPFGGTISIANTMHGTLVTLRLPLANPDG